MRGTRLSIILLTGGLVVGLVATVAFALGVEPARLPRSVARRSV